MRIMKMLSKSGGNRSLYSMYLGGHQYCASIVYTTFRSDTREKKWRPISKVGII